MSWIGYDWIGLDRIGETCWYHNLLREIGFDRIGYGWKGLDRMGMIGHGGTELEDWKILGWIGLGWVGLGRIGLDWIE